MPISPTDLATPIQWKDAKFTNLLADMQANILKGHGRSATRHLFFNVVAGKVPAARANMRILATMAKSARQQLDETEEFRLTGKPGGHVILVMLSHAGYKALGTAASKIPKDDAFVKGMTHPTKLQSLNDPAPTSWSPGFPTAPHAMVIVADASDALCAVVASDIQAKLGAAWKLVHTETGQAIFDDHGNGLEHFGYIDGRSQPLMLADEAGGEPMTQWNAAFGPDIVLVPDPAGTRGTESMGSYLVLRKLEQDVAGFKAAEAALARAQGRAASNFGLKVPHPQLAGAMMVGRFEDGSPVVSHAQPSGQTPPNDFNYSQDPDGANCPLHAHIRKTNPRDGSERRVIMARRGIPYGGAEGSGAPVGLLFMAYNRDIATQFEFIQQSWANSTTFPAVGTGLDPVIGQGQTRRPAYENCPIIHNDQENRRHKGEFQQYVTLRGGGYFFAPSLSGLANL